jgi:hypothetical protein
MPEKGQSPYPDMPDIHIGEAGVLKLLNSINSHKANDQSQYTGRTESLLGIIFVTQASIETFRKERRYIITISLLHVKLASL